jgi:pyruvate,water dikinase
MDIEWAKDGRSGELFLVQARPETVHARRDPMILERFQLETRGVVLACGQAPSDYPEFARVLVAEGIDSISLNPDSVLKTMLAIVSLEETVGQDLDGARPQMPAAR